MRPATKVLGLVGLILSFASLVYGNDLRYREGPDGKSFKGAFVEGSEFGVSNHRQCAVRQRTPLPVENLPEANIS